MNERIDIAAANNIAWCAIVCEIHGIASASSEHLWWTKSNAPMYYPDIITASRQVSNTEVADLIRSRQVSGIKDSYANLELSPYQYQILFVAEWIYRTPSASPDAAVPSSWSKVTTAAALERWASASGLTHVIRPELMNRQEVHIFIREWQGETAGFIASLGADAVGISNVFASAGSVELWPDIDRIAAAHFPGKPLVGYERGDDLTAAIQAGWTSIGPLRVWVKTGNAGP